ncbi:MAG: MBL fold metallo-hydrolase [Candidatus Electrothrix sp. YB6]
MEPVELKENVWWVANRSDALLEVNIYLLCYPHDRGQANIMIDPGPGELLTMLQKAVAPIIGGLENIHGVLINHQDPDVAPNAAFLQKLNPKCLVVASEDTWRLIHFLGLKASRFKAVESYRNHRATMPGGNSLIFVPSPFCHFRGAMMYYDTRSRVLFSGDLFAGLSYTHDLYATEESWEGIKTFHQLYMPSRDALQLAVSRIRNLDPPVKMIAPQHGSIIQGELIRDFTDRMYNLEVGLDLLIEGEKVENYLGAVNEILSELEQEDSSEVVKAVARGIASLNKDKSFTNILSVAHNRVTGFKVDPPVAIKTLLAHLREDGSAELEALVNLVALKILIGRNIPIANILPQSGEEELPDYFE